MIWNGNYWGIAVKLDGKWKLLGRYCWPTETMNRYSTIPTFATRREAREAKATLGSYRRESRVVRVTVTIEGMHGFARFPEQEVDKCRVETNEAEKKQP